ncbi:MAG: integrase arm-type DNA-binding domain-containing protein [Enterobacteriaceae bacterium]
MALSELTIRRAKATGKDYTLNDSDGLSFSVRASGGKAWLFRYYWQGQQKKLSLGTYPEIGLKEARDRRNEVRKLLAYGINPREHRQKAQQAAFVAEQHTFAAVFARWYEFRKLSLKEG